MGRHDDEQTLLRVDEAINKTYTRRNGAEMSISRICWDTGGIDPTIVYERSKKHGLFRVIPIKGASVYGKPVASMPRKRNKNGVCHRLAERAFPVPASSEWYGYSHRKCQPAAFC
ncbi:hypothetical protein DZ11F44_45250 [Escherichia coli]